MILGLGFGPRCCVNQGSGLTAVTRVHSSLAVGMQIRSGRGGNPVARAGDHVPGLGHGHPFGYRDATAFRSCQSNTATTALPTPAAAASFWFRHRAPRAGRASTVGDGPSRHHRAAQEYSMGKTASSEVQQSMGTQAAWRQVITGAGTVAQRHWHICGRAPLLQGSLSLPEYPSLI